MPRKLAVSILLFCLLIPSLRGQSDNILDRGVSIRFDDITIPAALRLLSRVSQVNFTYNSNIVPRTKVISTYFDVPLREILDDLFELENLFYKEVNGNVVILKREVTEKSIIGIVRDSTDKVPIPYANVFIQNSSLGAATDYYGYFKIDNVVDLGSELVVSHVGYKSQVVRFPFEIDQDTLEIELAEDPTMVDGITITAGSRKKRDREERGFLRRFKVDFLGRSENARSCKIVNLHVLEFDPLEGSEDGYMAKANQELIIENMAMGYSISYKLDQFIYDNGIITRKGQAQFTEKEPKSRRKNRRWEDARKKAYMGSDIHFMHSLLDGTSFEQGFRVNLLRYDSANSEYSAPLTRPDLSEILTIKGTNHLFQYQLNANYDLEITYQREFEDQEYVKKYRNKSKPVDIDYTDRRSRSTIQLGGDRVLTSSETTIELEISAVPLFQKSILVFRNKQPVVSYPGYFKNANDVIYLGWWTWGGFSEMLPLNYRPPEQSKKVVGN